MTNKRLDNDIEMEKRQLKQELGPDAGDTEMLGYAVMYTVGDVLVPHDWLADRAEELGIPQYVVPSKPRPSSAYKRAMSRLIDDTNGDGSERLWIQAPRMDNPEVEEPHKVDISIKEGENKVRHLYANVFFTEEEHPENPAGGTWDTHHLGHFDYSADSQRPLAFRDDDLHEDHLLAPVWETFRSRALDLFDEMKTTHIGHDIRQMMYYATRDYTTSVIQLRRSVYLFPVGLSGFVDSMKTLYEEIDEKYKTKGDPVAVRTLRVLEDEEEWVRQKVEAAMSETVDKALKTAWKEFADDATVDEVVNVIRENLVDGEETAEVYNALLETELDLREVLEERQAALDDEDREEVIERVLEDTDFDEV